VLQEEERRMLRKEEEKEGKTEEEEKGIFLFQHQPKVSLPPTPTS